MQLAEVRDLIDILHGSPLAVVSDCLRGFIVPAPGREFIGCDLSAIESRVLNWLAGEERVLEAYRGHGKIYEMNAANIYNVPMAQVTKEQRFIGKVAELALGYQGGKRAFTKISRRFRRSGP